jgi:hypothetical protein
MRRNPDRGCAPLWVYALGVLATLGLAGQSYARNGQWTQLCTAHGSVWMLIDRSDDPSPSPGKSPGGCHSGCTLPRKTRITR